MAAAWSCVADAGCQSEAEAPRPRWLVPGCGKRSPVEPGLLSCSCRESPAQQPHQHPTAARAAPLPKLACAYLCPQHLPVSLMCPLQVVRGCMPLIHSTTRQEASQ